MKKKVMKKAGKAILDNITAKPFGGKIFSEKEIEQKLSENLSIDSFHSFSCSLDAVHTNQYLTFHEDYSNSMIVDGENGFIIHGIFDGHSGNYSSKYLKENLVEEFLFSFSCCDQVDFKKRIQKSFRDSFVECDNNLVSQEKISGAAALVCAYLQNDDEFFFANTGNCRAVLGRREKIKEKNRKNDGDQGYQIKDYQLTNDHLVIYEEKKFQENFPDEDDIVLNHKIKGILDLSRSFGDALFKRGGKSLLMGTSDRFMNWNPPYITPKPEITHLKIDLEERGDKFIVIGSEGLFSVLSNFEIVHIVDNALVEGEDPTISLLKTLLEKAAKVGIDREQKLSSVLGTPEGFKKMLTKDITIKIFVFNEANSNQKEIEY